MFDTGSSCNSERSQMPRGPRGEKRPADVIGAAVMSYEHAWRKGDVVMWDIQHKRSSMSKTFPVSRASSSQRMDRQDFQTWLETKKPLPGQVIVETCGRF